MKNKGTIIFMYIILALPIPISLFSWIATIMSLASIEMLVIDSVGMLVATIISLFAMLLAGTYAVTYGVSLFITIRRKGLTFVSFLPILHILLTILLLILWSITE